ncbi:MAG TPA: enoyl-CoA hydratase/isomerase family protein [Steroidobacteraceae bacterium]|nr:enoyl-CoA hydratase/isomerase family protein [Steroidobacteraceae bacterium]
MSPAASTDAAASILTTLRNGVASVTLNRPASLNALSYGMVQDLQQQLRSFARDGGVKAVLLRGAGGRAFCAGGDVRALYDSRQSAASAHEAFFVAEYELDYLLHRYPKPTVALADGIAMGGGMGLVQGSRLRIVGEGTRMAMPEVAIGLFPDVGGSYFLSRLPGALGAYLALTGTPIRAADALYATLADYYLTPAQSAGLEAALASLVWSDDVLATLRAAIRELAGTANAPLAPARPATPGVAAPGTHTPGAPLAALRAAIDLHFSRRRVAEILDSLQRETRIEYAEWAAQTLQTLRSRSPTMLCVSLRQLQRGRTLSLADCFRMELGMVRQCFVQGDFIEGIRALIIDKDGAPHWQPDRIEAVSAADVEAFFEEHWAGAAHPLANLEGLANLG